MAIATTLSRIISWAVFLSLAGFTLYLSFTFLDDLWAITPAILRADYLFIVYRIDRLFTSGDWMGLVRFIAENQAGHTFIPYKIFAVANYALFGWDTILVKWLMRASLVFVAVSVTVVAVWRLRRHPWLAGLAMLGVTGIVLSYNGFDASVWADAAFVIYPLVGVALLALWSSDRAFRRASPSPRGVLLAPAALAALALVWNGSGIALLPALALLGFLHAIQPSAGFWRVIGRCAAICALALLPLLLAPLIARFATVGGDVSAEGLAYARGHLADSLNAFLMLLSWPIQQVHQDVALQIGSAMLALWLLLAGLAALRILDRESFLWIAYAGFGLASAAAVALTRTEYFFQVIKFIPSNYAIYAMPFVIGVFVALLTAIAQRIRSGPFFALPLASAAMALAAVLVVGFAGYVANVQSNLAGDPNRAKAIKLADLTRDASFLSRNWSLIHALRITGGDPRFSVKLLLDVLPSWRERGIVRAFSREFVSAKSGFKGQHSIQGLAAIANPLPEPRPVCPVADAIARVITAEPDTRMGLAEIAPDTPFARFAGVASSPLDCGQPADWIILSDRAGQIICAARPYPTQVDLPDAPRGKLSGNRSAFDFSCPMRSERLLAGDWAVHGWLEESRLLFDIPAGPL